MSLLAVTIGNVHGKYAVQPPVLDWPRLKAIRKETSDLGRWRHQVGMNGVCEEEGWDTWRAKTLDSFRMTPQNQLYGLFVLVVVRDAAGAAWGVGSTVVHGGVRHGPGRVQVQRQHRGAADMFKHKYREIRVHVDEVRRTV